MKAKKYTIYAVLIVLIAVGIYALTAFQRVAAACLRMSLLPFRQLM